MAWEVSTKTVQLTGSASMSSATGLNRSLLAIPGGVTITSYRLEWQMSFGVGAGTYGSFPVNQIARHSSWQVAISWVPSGNSPANLFSSPDDASFIDVHWSPPGFDRNTINTSNAPNYQDEFRWSDTHTGRIQIPSGTGGQFYWHVANVDIITVFSEWDVMFRATYA